MSDSSQPHNQLKKSSIGVWGIVFFVVAAAAPQERPPGAGQWSSSWVALVDRPGISLPRLCCCSSPSVSPP